MAYLIRPCPVVNVEDTGRALEDAHRSLNESSDLATTCRNGDTTPSPKGPRIRGSSFSSLTSIPDSSHTHHALVNISRPASTAPPRASQQLPLPRPKTLQPKVPLPPTQPPIAARNALRASAGTRTMTWRPTMEKMSSGICAMPCSPRNCWMAAVRWRLTVTASSWGSGVEVEVGRETRWVGDEESIRRRWK